jgi:hypothetical protein
MVFDSAMNWEWLTIEGCSCGRYAVWMDLVATRRLKHISLEERGRLRAAILDLRASSRDAWLATENDLIDGRLVIRPTERSFA